MEHTSLLARRAFPPQARVSGDLHCAGCGYNLRGARLTSVCPECGRTVADALWPLARPDKVAAAFRRIGNSFLGVAPALVVPVVLTGWCMGWIALAVVFATSAVRIIEVAELRFRADAHTLPIVGERVRRLWGLAMLEMALLAVWSVTLISSQVGGGMGWIAASAGLAGVGWLSAAFGVAGMTGWMGAAVAALLGKPRVVRLMSMQVAFVLAGPAIAVAFAVLGMAVAMVNGAAGAVVASFGLAGLLVAWIIAVGLTLPATAQLATAVERARDPREELIG